MQQEITLTQAEQGITSPTGVSWYNWLSPDKGQVSTHISLSPPSFVPAFLLSSIYSFSVNKDIQRLWRLQAKAYEAENASEEAISLVSMDVFPNENACRREERRGRGREPGTWQQLLRLRSHGKVTSGKCFQRAADVQITASSFKLQQLCSNLTLRSSGAIYVR